jgi:hypothetical protein
MIMVQILTRGLNNKYYFSLLPIINWDIFTVPATMSGLNKIIFGILGFAIILLYSIINIVAYLGIMYIIKYTNLEDKYPKLKPIIKYYQGTSTIFLIIEIIFVIGSLLIIIGLCLHLLYINNTE